MTTLRNRPEQAEKMPRLRLEPTVDWWSPNTFKRSSITMMYTAPLVELDFLRFIHERKKWLCWMKLLTNVVCNILMASTLTLVNYEMFTIACSIVILTIAFISESFIIWFFRGILEHPLPALRTVAQSFEVAVTVGCVMIVIVHSVLLFLSSHHCEEYDKRRYGVDQELTCTSTVSWILIFAYISPLIIEKPRFAIVIPSQVASFILFNVLFGLIV